MVIRSNLSGVIGPWRRAGRREAGWRGSDGREDGKGVEENPLARVAIRNRLAGRCAATHQRLICAEETGEAKPCDLRRRRLSLQHGT